MFASAAELKEKLFGANSVIWHSAPEKDRPLVLVFLSPQCPNSKSHLDALTALSKQYPEFEFVGVHSNQDESAESAKVYFKNSALPFPVLEDSQAQIADLLKAFKTPHVFVVGVDGQILYRGGITNSSDPKTATQFFLKDALARVARRQRVIVAEGRTLGCIISREKKNVW